MIGIHRNQNVHLVFGIMVMLVLIITSVISAGCTTRDTSTPQKALLGHWKSEDGSTDAFYSGSKYTWVDKSGKTMTSDYSVLQSNLKTYEIDIRIKTQYGMGHDDNITLSDDRKVLTTKTTAFGVTVDARYKYVDAKTSPSQ